MQWYWYHKQAATLLPGLLFRPAGWGKSAHLTGTLFLQDTSIELRTVYLPYEPI